MKSLDPRGEPKDRRGGLLIGTSLNSGVVATFWRTVAARCHGTGLPVTIITSTRGAAAVSGADVLQWPSPRPTRWRDAWFLARHIRSTRPKAVVGNFGAVNLMIVIGALFRVPVRIAWYHTLSSQIVSASPTFTERLQIARKRLVYRLSTVVVANSEAARRDVCATYRVPDHRVRVVLNAVPKPESEIPRLPTDRTDTIVCASGLIRNKGHEALLRGFAGVLPHRPGMRLRLLGSGPERERLEAITEELGLRGMVEFVGSVSHREVVRAMAVAKAVAVPSYHEAFGLVAAEALAVGTPVVASDVDGLWSREKIT